MKLFSPMATLALAAAGIAAGPAAADAPSMCGGPFLLALLADADVDVAHRSDSGSPRVQLCISAVASVLVVGGDREL